MLRALLLLRTTFTTSSFIPTLIRSFSTAMNSRKLASIRKVSDVRPIPKADRIEVAVVDGWKCVVKKGEFAPGETVVYCEIDSFLPVRPEFEFLRKSSFKKLNNGDEGFRLRTVKLRGEISQGLLLPLKILNDASISPPPQLGDDVTELLGIQKYEEEPDLGAEHLAPFPAFIPKTDAIRVQNIDLQPFFGTKFHVSEKLDGTSCTVFWDGDRFGLCSRNHEITGGKSPHAVWAAASGLAERLPALGRRLALQGELVGPKLQSNRYALKEVNLYIFSIWDMDANAYVKEEDLELLATEQLGLPTAPVLFGSVELPKCDTDEMLLFAEDPSTLHPGTEREGLVWIQGTEWGRVSIKTISNKFLTKVDS